MRGRFLSLNKFRKRENVARVGYIRSMAINENLSRVDAECHVSSVFHEMAQVEKLINDENAGMSYNL